MGAGTSTAVKLAASHAAARKAANATTDQLQPEELEPVEGTEVVRIYLGKAKKARAPSTYQLSRWEKRYATLFDSTLKGAAGQAPIRLVDAHWLVKAAKSRIITHRQALPAAAFLTLSELQMCGTPNGVLPIICVSYPWLSPTHPDPDGFHIATLAKALRALTAETADASATLVGPANTQRYGVFLDVRPTALRIAHRLRTPNHRTPPSYTSPSHTAFVHLASPSHLTIAPHHRTSPSHTSPSHTSPSHLTIAPRLRTSPSHNAFAQRLP